MIGEKSIPDIGGNMLLTGWYKGSHSSLINENNGWLWYMKNQLATAPMIIIQKNMFKIVLRSKPSENIKIWDKL